MFIRHSVFVAIFYNPHFYRHFVKLVFYSFLAIIFHLFNLYLFTILCFFPLFHELITISYAYR